MDQQLGTMGKYVRTYRPNVLSPHRITNNLFGLPSRPAFPSAAVVVQQKKIPDVSFYQGPINYTLMRMKTDALIIRCGQNLWQDVQFTRNWVESRSHGIFRGGYWFYDDRVDPGRQAELWWKMLRDDPPEMEIWADWENTYGGQFGGLRNVVAFMQAMEQALPSVEVGMYCGYWWIREHSNAVTNAAQYEYLKRKKLFEAFYTNNAANVLVPHPWTSLYLWQFGTPAVGHEYGVATREIDMSFINMTEEEFKQKYGGEVVPPPPPGESMLGKVLVTLNIRPRAAVEAGVNPIGQLMANDLVEASTEVNGWWKLTKITRGSTVISLPAAECYAYEGATNGYIQPIESPPPPTQPITIDSVVVNYTENGVQKSVTLP